MARSSNPAVMAGAAVVGLVLVVLGVVLAIDHHPRRGPALVVLGLIIAVAGYLVDRRARRATPR
jgi:hypothetical protein